MKDKTKNSKAKQIISFALALLMIFSCIVFDSGEAKVSAYDTNELVRLMIKFPHGKYWNHVGSGTNNPDGYTSTPCTHHGTACSYEYPGACECNWFNGGIQCAGYAYKISYEITGSYVSEDNGWTKNYNPLDLSKLCVGDIIRYYNGTHSITVLGVKGDKIAYTGANWGANCLIKWGTLDKSKIVGFSYVYHQKSNGRKNSNFSFLDGIGADVPDTPGDTQPTYSAETWEMDSENALNVRAEASTSTSVVGRIPAGGKFTVSKKVVDSENKYLWGKVKYGSTSGWAVLNWATYLGGSKETVELDTVKPIFAGFDYELSWNAVEGADSYEINVYDANKNLLSSTKSSATNRTIKITKSGKHYLRVRAMNSFAKGMILSSGKISVSVLSSSEEKLKKISLRKNVKVSLGQTLFIEYEIDPITAFDDMTWKSSDESIATVNEDGKVSTKGVGKVKITCSSINNPLLKATTTLTVIPKKPEGVKRSKTGNTTSTIKVEWKADSRATGYRLYRVTSNGKYKNVADVRNRTYAYCGGLSAGKTYKLAVREYKVVGNETLYGPFLKITASTVPSGLSSLKLVNRTTSNYTLSWKAVKNATKYYIYKYNRDKKVYEKVGSTTTTSKTLTGNASQPRKYKVCPVIVKNGIELIGSGLKIRGFRAPTKVSATAIPSKTSISLKWTKSPLATSYEVYQKSGSKFVLVATLKPSVRNYTKQNLSKNKAYTFKIKAVAKYDGKIKKSETIISSKTLK